MFFLWFFFVKQKTAYELRISDWSSDVCSSDLVVAVLVAMVTLGTALPAGAGLLSDTTTTSDSTSRYDDPFFLNWASYLPSTAPDTYVASTADVCKNGQDA